MNMLNNGTMTLINGGQICSQIKNVYLLQNTLSTMQSERHSIHDVMNDHDTLVPADQNQLKDALTPFEDSFDKKHDLCASKPLHFQTKANAHLKHHTACPIPAKYLLLVKEEVNRLVKLNVLEPTRNATHAAPCFVQPKKDGTIHFLIDFRELNKILIQELFLLPKIKNIIQSLEHFTYVITLDLSMCYKP